MRRHKDVYRGGVKPDQREDYSEDSFSGYDSDPNFYDSGKDQEEALVAKQVHLQVPGFLGFG